MTLSRFEIAYVSADRGLVDFFVEVFDLKELDPITATPGTVYRLDAPGATIKVMVPTTTPTAAAPGDQLATTGMRYITMFVDNLETVLERATSRGARVQFGPKDIGDGVQMAVLRDPYGNAVEAVYVPS